MTTERYSAFNLFVHRIASTRPGAWFFARTEHHLDRIFLKLTKGRRTLTGILGGFPVVRLTTTGAKSGLARTVPLLYISDEDNPDAFAVIASNFGQRHYPAWYFNLKANPRATGSIRGQVREYIAREASGDEYERIWQRALDVYSGFPLYKQRVGERHIPIMVLSPAKQ